MDTIADMLTTLANAQRVGKERIAVPHSRFKEQLVRLLKEKGAVAGVRVQDTARPKLVITLAYENGQPRVRQAIRLSKPGRRMYVGHNQLPWAVEGVNSYIISTSEGLMDERGARTKGLGGELICELRRQ
jgi:small subunit ribosomal protein S8